MKISESTFYFIGIANGIMQARQPLRLTAEARIRLRPFVCRVPALPAPLPRARAPAAAAVRPHTSATDISLALRLAKSVPGGKSWKGAFGASRSDGFDWSRYGFDWSRCAT